MTILTKAHLSVLCLTAAVVAFRDSPSTPMECLHWARRRKKRTLDDLLIKILQAIAASDPKQRIWRVNIADCMEKEKVDRRKVQEKGRKLYQGIMGLFLAANTSAEVSCGAIDYTVVGLPFFAIQK